MSISEVVKNNLCTGCGACVSEDTSGNSYMVWNEDGFLVPKSSGDSSLVNMYKVCPFNLEGEINEDHLSKEFLSDTKFRDDDIGGYSSIYVGYSNSYRITSSSGGIATFVFEKLLREKHVDHLFIVKELNGKYEYQLFNNADEITKISKTRYYPVTLESIYKIIEDLDGKVAISGVACFIKSIRLKQHFNPHLKEKIAFLIGIICGGLKSKFYTDFLAQSAGCTGDYHTAEYRLKNDKSYALDYKFSCVENTSNQQHVVRMLTLGDMWGTGLFKSKACDFCDDVTTELADISLGDAWIPPYNKDGLGNSVIVARSPLAVEIVNSGISNQELTVSVLELNKFKSSQSGSFNHRHKGLLFRINREKRKSSVYPVKRSRFLKSQSLIFNIIQMERELTRSKSLEFWRKYNDIQYFNKSMKPYVFALKKTTGLNHKIIKIKSKLR